MRSGSGLSKDTMTQASLGTGQSGIGYKRAGDIAAPAHLRALTAAKPRIHGMIQDAVRAGLSGVNEQLLAQNRDLREAHMKSLNEM